MHRDPRPDVPDETSQSPATPPHPRIATVARPWIQCLACLGLWLIWPARLPAQSNTDGAIIGQAPAGSIVHARDLDTNTVYETRTDPSGTFRFGALPPGHYAVVSTADSGSERTVNVLVGAHVTANLITDTIDLEELHVEAQATRPMDFGGTESSLVLPEKLIDQLPVPRSEAGVALLCPGAIPGDTSFNQGHGTLVSFGGASVAENAYYINGFNVSDFRKGVEPSRVPFEFYDQFEIKSGAYSAEFGRATGGVINATTKRGTNQFRGAISYVYQPAFARARGGSRFYVDEFGARTPSVYNHADRFEAHELNVSLGGPLVRDRVFFHGVYSLRRQERTDVENEGTQHEKSVADDPFWGLKLDALPLPGHRFEATWFSDRENETIAVRDYDWLTRTRGPTNLQATNRRGGLNQVYRYTARLGDRVTASALYGRGQANRTSTSTVDAEPAVEDMRAGTYAWLSGNPFLVVEPAARDTREAMRLDLEVEFPLAGAHRLRAGWDAEDNTSRNQSTYSGGVYYTYFTAEEGGVVPVPNGNVPTEPDADDTIEVARELRYENSGRFAVESTSFYLEDNWSLPGDRLLLRLGVRDESFRNRNARGETFVDVDHQIAPRLGVSYDLDGERRTRLFANFGRYHLPVPAIISVRLGGGEYFSQAYHVLDGVNADGSPILGDQIGDVALSSDGSVRPPGTIADQDLRPMYQDEWVLGLQHAFHRSWSAGVRFIARDLGSAIEDVTVDHALNAYAARHGLPTLSPGGPPYYVLANPGRPIRMQFDFDGDGATEDVLLTSADLRYPRAHRTYHAIELVAERLWDERWWAQFSYTWSQSRGNIEGWVRSDNGQDDAGMTTAFDSLGSVLGSEGYLPNDRRHAFKASAIYALNKAWQISGNAMLISGRPINGFGVWPLDQLGDDPAAYYGAGFFMIDGAVVPRGSIGRTPWIFDVNLGLRHQTRWFDRDVTLQLDVFNVFNRNRATEVWEYAEDDAGAPNPKWRAPTTLQTPRHWRFSLNVAF